MPLDSVLASSVAPQPYPAPTHRDVTDAVRRVLPASWQVLPDGRSTASVVARTVGDLARRRGSVVDDPRFGAVVTCPCGLRTTTEQDSGLCFITCSCGRALTVEWGPHLAGVDPSEEGDR